MQHDHRKSLWLYKLINIIKKSVCGSRCHLSAVPSVPGGTAYCCSTAVLLLLYVDHSIFSIRINEQDCSELYKVISTEGRTVRVHKMVHSNVYY